MAEEKRASEAERLDQEIASLEEQVASVKKQLQVETSTILSSTPGQNLLKSSGRGNSRMVRSTTRLAAKAAQQEAHTQQCFHRICNPVTAFKVLDPDPNAVDGGHVLGLRFEVMTGGQFLRPYYVMLNRPYTDSTSMRVHRHTIPPAIPLAGLAARYLPSPAPGRTDGEEESSRPQDLDRFVRTLRRELVRYHNRLGASADLRRGLGLHQETRQEDEDDDDILEIGIADIEAKQINLTWADERSGRLVMNDDGKVVKLMVFGPEGGRDWETTTRLSTEGEHIEDVAKKLQEFGKG